MLGSRKIKLITIIVFLVVALFALAFYVYAYPSPTVMGDELTTFIRSNREVLGIVGSSLGGLVAVSGLMLRARKRRYVTQYLKKIDGTFNNFLDDQERCRKEIVSLQRDLDALFMKGKLDESQHSLLARKTELYLQKLRARHTRLGIGGHVPEAP